MRRWEFAIALVLLRLAVAVACTRRHTVQAARVAGEVAMDRFETDATADANGDVHVHVGAPGVRVHVVVDAPAPPERVGTFAAVLDRVYGSSPDFPWQTPDGKEPVAGGGS